MTQRVEPQLYVSLLWYIAGEKGQVHFCNLLLYPVLLSQDYHNKSDCKTHEKYSTCKKAFQVSPSVLTFLGSWDTYAFVVMIYPYGFKF